MIVEKLISLLEEYKDFEVESSISYADGSDHGLSVDFANLCGISDIGHSDKVIILDFDFSETRNFIEFLVEKNKQQQTEIERLKANQPVICGEWIFRCIAGEDPYLCSLCGNTVDAYGYSYCPNCGAYMEGEDNG